MTEKFGTIGTDGAVSSTGEPLVVVELEGKAWQWTPEEARAFAVLLIRTAGFAEDDAILLRELRAKGLPDEAVYAFITAVRDARP